MISTDFEEQLLKLNTEMNNPEASLGVSNLPLLKQAWLLLMQLPVLSPSLTLHLLPNHILAPMLAHCRHKVPFRPELSAPQLPLHPWHAPEYLPRR